jgi:hypothetical protein
LPHVHQRTLAKLIVISVLCWGAFHAVGAYRLNHNPARPVVVLAFSLLFLGAFMAVFRISRLRLERREEERRLEREADDETTES